MKKSKVFSLVWGIIALVLSGFMIYVCFGLNAGLGTADGLARLSLIVLIPVVIIIYVITISLTISALLSSIRLMQSEDKGFKITGIVILALSIVAIGGEMWAIISLLLKI